MYFSKQLIPELLDRLYHCKKINKIKLYFVKVLTSMDLYKYFDKML